MACLMFLSSHKLAWIISDSILILRPRMFLLSRGWLSALVLHTLKKKVIYVLSHEWDNTAQNAEQRGCRWSFYSSRMEETQTRSPTFKYYIYKSSFPYWLLCSVFSFQAQAPWLEALISRGGFPLSRLIDSSDDELRQRSGGRHRVFKSHAPRNLLPCCGFEQSGAKVKRYPHPSFYSAVFFDICICIMLKFPISCHQEQSLNPIYARIKNKKKHEKGYLCRAKRERRLHLGFLPQP